MFSIFRYLCVTVYIQLFSFRTVSVFNKLSSVQFSSVYPLQPRCKNMKEPDLLAVGTRQHRHDRIL